MDSPRPPLDDSSARRRARNDLVVLVAVCLVALFALGRINAFEAFAAWSRTHENWQLDEILSLGILAALGLAVFSMRRWIDLKREQARRATAEKSAQRLEGLLPICSGCKRIREQDGAWTPVEQYFAVRLEADFTHGLCPECRQRLYPELSR